MEVMDTKQSKILYYQFIFYSLRDTRTMDLVCSLSFLTAYSRVFDSVSLSISLCYVAFFLSMYSYCRWACDLAANPFPTKEGVKFQIYWQFKIVFICLVDISLMEQIELGT